MIVALGFVLTGGCSELIIQEEDDGSAIIGKTMYRIVLAIGTFGYSEVKMNEVMEEYEREQKLKVFENRMLEFVRSGELTQAEADLLIEKERARLWKEAQGEARTDGPEQLPTSQEK